MEKLSFGLMLATALVSTASAGQDRIEAYRCWAIKTFPIIRELNPFEKAEVVLYLDSERKHLLNMDVTHRLRSGDKAHRHVQYSTNYQVYLKYGFESFTAEWSGECRGTSQDCRTVWQQHDDAKNDHYLKMIGTLIEQDTGEGERYSYTEQLTENEVLKSVSIWSCRPIGQPNR